MKQSAMIWIIAAFCLLPAAKGFSAENRIDVDCTNLAGEVPELLYGSNLLAHDPARSSREPWAKNFSGYREFGAGIWDPDRMHPVSNVVALGREAGITLLRFPGGCGSHGYEWKKAIVKGRNRFKFGLYEFLRVCKELRAEAVITLSYFSDTPQDAADLVAFLNSPYDQGGQRISKNQWAGIRADHGHPESLQVKYFEVGNEVWHGNHLNIKSVKPEEYARRYLQYYDAMKAVDPSVMVGVVLDKDPWNRKVIPLIKDKVDFGILHTYPAPGYGKELEKLPVEKLFSMCLGMPESITQPHYQKTLQLFREHARKEVPLAITEYNGGFFLRSAVPYQFTLGNALINAELLRIFMKPENHILMANHWNFINEHWGMIGNGFDQDAAKLEKPYIKRPNYFVFELYHQHFGRYLLPVSVASKAYRERGYSIDYISVNASTNQDRSKIYLMVLNKNLKQSMPVEITLRGCGENAKAEAWVLNGPDYLAMNELSPDTVKIRQVDLNRPIKNGRLVMELEPHSLTAIEISQ